MGEQARVPLKYRPRSDFCQNSRLRVNFITNRTPLAHASPRARLRSISACSAALSGCLRGNLAFTSGGTAAVWLAIVSLMFPGAASAAGELQQAEQLVESGQTAEAIALVQRYGKSSDPAWAQVHSAALLASGQSRKAVDLLAPLHAADPLNLSLANNYAVALEAIGATDTARQVLERALGDGLATAAAFRNLRSLYAKLAATAYAKSIDAPPYRATPTLALVLPSTKQALALTAPSGDGVAQLARGLAPSPAIAPLAAIGPPPARPTAPPASAATTVATAAAPAASAAAAIATPAAQSSGGGSTATAATSATLATSKPVQVATATPAKPEPPKPVERSAEKASDKAAEKPIDKANADKANADKASERVADKPPVNERQVAAQAQLERATAAWAGAWSRKDVGAYLAFYGRSFQPPPGLNRSEWEKQRH